MDLVDIINAKLPIEIRPDEVTLSFYISEVECTIKNYIKRSVVPGELKFVHANMVVDLIKSTKRTEDEKQSVSSIKEGDVQVQFGAVKKEAGERETESLIFNYKDQLKRFRRLGW